MKLPMIISREIHWPLSEERLSWITGRYGDMRTSPNGSIARFVGARRWSCSCSTLGNIEIIDGAPCSAKPRRSGSSRHSRGPKRFLNLLARRCPWPVAEATVGTVIPPSARRCLRYIREKKITGVIFLSADLHCAAITRIPKSSGLRNITAGPLAAPLNRVTNGTARRYEFFMAENFNFAKITVDPKAEPVQALVEFIDQDNRLFYSTKMKPV